MINLEVIRAVDSSSLPSDEQFQSWAELAASTLSGEAELCIRIVDETESQTLNREYRGKDTGCCVEPNLLKAYRAGQGRGELLRGD